MKPLPKPVAYITNQLYSSGSYSKPYREKRLSWKADDGAPLFTSDQLRAYAASERAADLKAMRGALEALQDYCKGTFVDRRVIVRICCGTPELTRPHHEKCKGWNAITALTELLKD